MADLSVEYLGFTLKNPLIAAASPLSKELDSARHLQDAGASAVVMYSLHEEEILADERRYERFIEHQSLGHGEASSFLPAPPGYVSKLDKYLEQLATLKQHLDIPVVASLNGVSHQGWVEYGQELQSAGADALELNVYYIASNINETAADVEQHYLDVVSQLLSNVTIPVAVKLSPQFSSPLAFIRDLYQAGANAVVLFNRIYQSDINLDTLKVEPHLQLSTPYEALMRIRWAALVRGVLDVDISVTGGFHSSDDVIKALLAGTNTVQLCSTLLQHGPGEILSLLQALNVWLDEHEYESVGQMQGSLSCSKAENPEAYSRAGYQSVLDSFTPPPGVRY